MSLDSDVIQESSLWWGGVTAIPLLLLGSQLAFECFAIGCVQDQLAIMQKPIPYA